MLTISTHQVLSIGTIVNAPSRKDYRKLSDEELITFSEQNKPSPIVDAFIIGFLFGIIIFSVAASSWGLVTLIPLYLIYVFLKKPKRQAAIKEELKKRDL